MKVLRVILIILVILALIAVILGLAGPKSFDVNRTATIDAPPELVFPYLKSLKQGDRWGPWRGEDDKMQTTHEGEEGTVGSKSTWEGPKVGKGQHVITAIEENKSVETDITFYQLWGESNANGYYLLDDKGDQSEVTWGIKGENNFIGRIFGVFMDMEEGIGPMFEKGLNNLNELVKSDLNRAWNGHEVDIVQLSAQSYVGARQEVSMDALAEFYGATYGKVMYAMGRAKVDVAGMPCGLYYTWDEEKGVTDVMAAMPVSEPVTLKDFQTITLPAGRGLQVDFYGNYDNLGNAHVAIDSFMDNFDLEAQAPVVEQYVTDPSTEPDTSKWLTKVMYRLQ